MKNSEQLLNFWDKSRLDEIPRVELPAISLATTIKLEAKENLVPGDIVVINDNVIGIALTDSKDGKVRVMTHGIFDISFDPTIPDKNAHRVLEG